MHAKNLLRYEIGPIRPPSEAHSLLVRFTRNCPWNKCEFCHLYKGTRFERRPLAEIKKDIDTIEAIRGEIAALSWQRGAGGKLSQEPGRRDRRRPPLQRFLQGCCRLDLFWRTQRLHPGCQLARHEKGRLCRGAAVPPAHLPRNRPHHVLRPFPDNRTALYRRRPETPERGGADEAPSRPGDGLRFLAAVYAQGDHERAAHHRRTPYKGIGDRAFRICHRRSGRKAVVAGARARDGGCAEPDRSRLYSREDAQSHQGHAPLSESGERGVRPGGRRGGPR